MLVPAIVSACTCSRAPETCDLLAKRDVAIVGTVLDGSGLVRVEKAIRGLARGVRDVEVRSATDSSCGLNLRPGERWLIFGTRGSDGSVGTDVCSGSRPIRSCGTLDRLVDSFLAGPNLVMGTVRRFGAGADDNGISDAEVRLTGPEDRAIRTSRDGSFEFSGLTPGTYRLDIQSAGLVPSVALGSIREIDLRSFRVEARGCVAIPVTMHANQSIRGTIRTPAGKPAEDVMVNLLPRDGDRPPDLLVRSTWTVADGTYEFRRVENGTYVVEAGGETGEDPKWTPEAVVSPPFAVTGNGAEGIDLVTDSPRFAGIVLKVTGSNGRPPTHAIVEVARAGEYTLKPLDPAEELRVLDGEEYTISVRSVAVAGSEPENGSVTVKASRGATVEIRLRK